MQTADFRGGQWESSSVSFMAVLSLTSCVLGRVFASLGFLLFFFFMGEMKSLDQISGLKLLWLGPPVTRFPRAARTHRRPHPDSHVQILTHVHRQDKRFPKPPLSFYLKCTLVFSVSHRKAGPDPALNH